MAVTRDAAVMLVDGRMLADTDLGDRAGPVAMYSTAPDEPDWATGIAAAGAAAVGRAAAREEGIAVTIGKKAAEQPVRPGRRPRLRLGALIGSGDRIGGFVLPFVLVGVALNIAFPEAFSVGGPPSWLRVVSALVLAVGVVVWAWSVLLILTKVRAGDLVTTGPYSLVKHPLYTSVALLVLPWLGFLLDTWLGALIGIALYLASRLFAPAEEADLAGRFGPQWDAYCRHVKVPWL